MKITWKSVFEIVDIFGFDIYNRTLILVPNVLDEKPDMWNLSAVKANERVTKYRDCTRKPVSSIFPNCSLCRTSYVSQISLMGVSMAIFICNKKCKHNSFDVSIGLVSIQIVLCFTREWGSIPSSTNFHFLKLLFHQIPYLRTLRKIFTSSFVTLFPSKYTKCVIFKIPLII